MILLPVEHAKTFILAGNSYFTMKNTNNGNFMHFHVYESKNRFWVEVKKGSLVESEGGEKGGNWVDLGEIRDGVLTRSWRSRNIDVQSTEFKAFNWLLSKLQGGQWNDVVVLYRHVWCGRCGRHLMDEVSVEDGLGAHCFKQIHKMTRAQYRRRKEAEARALASAAIPAGVPEEDRDGEDMPYFSPMMIPGVAARMIATMGMESDEAQRVWDEMEREAGK